MVKEEDKVLNRLETEFFGRFNVLDVDPQLILNFREAQGSDPKVLKKFWDSTREMGRVGAEAAANKVEEKIYKEVYDIDLLVLSIPRGSYPAQEGVEEALNPEYVVVLNAGGIKEEGMPLVGVDLGGLAIKHLVYVDPVVDTGKTFDEVQAALNGARVESFSVISVIVHPPTALRLLDENPNLSIFTADTESRTMVPLDGSEGRWLAGFGDIGGLVEEATNLGIGKMVEPGLRIS